MEIKRKLVLHHTGQTVELVIEIDEAKLCDEMAKRCILNDTWKSTLLFGAIKAEVVK